MYDCYTVQNFLWLRHCRELQFLCCTVILFVWCNTIYVTYLHVHDRVKQVLGRSKLIYVQLSRIILGEHFANCTKLGQLILSKIIKILTSRSHILRL